MKVITAVLLVVAAVSASGATIAPGDVAVAAGGYCCCITCPPDPPAHLLDNNGQLKATLPAAGAVAFGSNGHLFLGDRTKVTEYDASLAVVRTFPPLGSPILHLTVALNGDVYALSESGTLTIFTSAGALKNSIALPAANGTPAALDLAPDQCTLFYIDSTVQGRRFNVCTNAPLANLPAGQIVALRATGDGGYVTASIAALSVYDASDHLLRTYPNGAPDAAFGLAFDVDPGILWYASGSALSKFRFADGSRTAVSTVYGASVAVDGEARPTSTAIAAAGIPALSTTVLGALAIALIALAWHRLGR